MIGSAPFRGNSQAGASSPGSIARDGGLGRLVCCYLIGFADDTRTFPPAPSGLLETTTMIPFKRGSPCGASPRFAPVTSSGWLFASQSAWPKKGRGLPSIRIASNPHPGTLPRAGPQSLGLAGRLISTKGAARRGGACLSFRENICFRHRGGTANMNRRY